MVEAKQKTDWQHTASIMALTANCHQGKGGKMFKPDDFMPRFAKPKPMPMGIEALKMFLPKDQRGK